MRQLSITDRRNGRGQSTRRGFVASVLACVLSLAGCQGAAVPEQDGPGTGLQPVAESPAEPTRDFPLGLPVLLDLGATKCIPCKMMAPILDELGEEYAGVMRVIFIDVWENSNAGSRYGIESIPTQIFYDAEGKELFRHVGFISKEDILAKWNELGVELAAKNPPASSG